MSPAEHRRRAYRLEEEAPDNPKARYLAVHHRWLADHIQKKLNAGLARIKGR